MFPNGTDPVAGMMRNPPLPIRALTELESSIGRVPGQMRAAGAELGSTLGRVPSDFMGSLRRASGGNYAPTRVDAYGAGAKAREDYPYPLPFQWMYEPRDQQMDRYQNLVRDLGWGQ